MIDFDKYNPLKMDNNQEITEVITPKLTNWQDSAPVVRLFEYIKQHHNEGMKLSQFENGRPSLQFDPGLGCADMNTERWQIALGAVELLQNAAADLEQLLTDGLIVLHNNRK